MPDINDLHKFYEANLPEYERKDIARVSRFFVQEIGMPAKKPIKWALIAFDKLKRFVTYDWQGFEEIRTKKIYDKPTVSIPKESPKPKEKKKEYGKCPRKGCKGHFIKKQNRSDKSFFLGCSTWPKCSNTKPLLD